MRFEFGVVVSSVISVFEYRAKASRSLLHKSAMITSLASQSPVNYDLETTLPGIAWTEKNAMSLWFGDYGLREYEVKADKNGTDISNDPRADGHADLAIFKSTLRQSRNLCSPILNEQRGLESWRDFL
jgi:hypothetical protein